jgi:hypothetical protein
LVWLFPLALTRLKLLNPESHIQAKPLAESWI